MYSKNAGGRASDKVWIAIWGKYLPCFWSQPQPPRRDYGLGSGSPQGMSVDANLPGEEIPVPMKSLGGPSEDPFLTPQPLAYQFCSIGAICKVGVGWLFYPDQAPKVGGEEVHVIVPGLLGMGEPI